MLDVAENPHSDLYLALVAHVNGQRIELPDDADLLRELRGLERRRGPSGKDRVDHRPGPHGLRLAKQTWQPVCRSVRPGFKSESAPAGLR